ncbi:putative protein disulfide-isomerase C1F5.02 [Cucumispora dikerogammari]|nr:putative protein disulfide-isomerase C1F5.02 [Cucumispora dikerogammari]
MHLFILSISASIILEGKLSTKTQEKYKNTITVKHSKQEGLTLKTSDNTINLENEDEIEKTLTFIEKSTPVPKDMTEILEILTTKKEKITVLDLIKTGHTNFIIHFFETSADIYIGNKSDKNIPILYSTDKEVAKKLNVPFPGYLGFNADEQVIYKIPSAVNNNNVTLENAINFISLPVLGLVTQESAIRYETGKIPIFYMLVKKGTEQEVIKEYLNLAVFYKNELKIGIVEYNPNAQLHKSMSSEEKLPTVVVYVKGEKLHIHNSTPDALKSFISDFKDGKLEPPIREEQPVDNSNRSLKIAVRVNADELILNKQKDVLVVFYAYWCHFCKTLMPILEDLAEKLGNNKTVDVVKLDLALNDLPQYKVSHYPFIRLYKGETNETVDFTGNSRDIGEILKFIKDNGHYKSGLDIIDSLIKELRKVEIGKEKGDL